MKSRLAATSLIVLLIMISGCGDKSPAAPTPAVTVVSVAVTGNATLTAFGETSQLFATATLSTGLTQDQTNAAQWSSSNIPVATVSGNGMVTAVSEGTAEIRATFQNVTGTKTATVILACRVNNTASVRFGNRSATTSQDIIWDGLRLFTLAPGQTSDPVTVVAGVAHALLFKIANSSAFACTASSPIPPQCATPLYSCSGP